MLRITIFDSPAEQKWVLQGRLTGPWAAELNATWQKEHAQCKGRRCIVDVSQVTFVDASGEGVLTEMMAEGARFVVSGLYAKHVVKNLEARCKSRSKTQVTSWLDSETADFPGRNS